MLQHCVHSAHYTVLCTDFETPQTFRTMDVHYTGCYSLSYSPSLSVHTVLHFVIQPQLATRQCATVWHTAPAFLYTLCCTLSYSPSLLLDSVLQFTIPSHLSLCTVFSLPMSQAFQYTVLQFSTSLQPPTKQCAAFCHTHQPTATQSVVCRSTCSTWWTSYAFSTPPMCWPSCHWDI